MREADIRTYLDNKVLNLGGVTRATKYLGKKNCPDVLVIFPLRGKHAMVETKRPGKSARDGQAREHELLNASGIETVVLNTTEAVENWLTEFLGKN
jgi:tRNA G37 N-methylase TrmD